MYWQAPSLILVLLPSSVEIGDWELVNSVRQFQSLVSGVLCRLNEFLPREVLRQHCQALTWYPEALQARQLAVTLEFLVRVLAYGSNHPVHWNLSVSALVIMNQEHLAVTNWH